MKYKVLIPMVYGGNLYEVGKIVDILEKETAKNCLERKLITEDEILDSIVDEKAEDPETGPEKTTYEVVTEEKTEEIENENEDQKTTNKSDKNGKIKNK